MSDPWLNSNWPNVRILRQHSAREIEILIQNLSSTIPFTIFVPLKHCGLPHHDHGVIADLLPPNKAKRSLSLTHNTKDQSLSLSIEKINYHRTKGFLVTKAITYITLPIAIN